MLDDEEVQCFTRDHRLIRDVYRVLKIARIKK